MILVHSSIDGAFVNSVEEGETWMAPIINYLVNEELPSSKNETRKLIRRAAHYAFKFG